MHRRATRYRPLAINLFLVGIAAFLIHGLRLILLDRELGRKAP